MSQDLKFQDYLGFCPISNPDNATLVKGNNSKIPMFYLGYEVLANSAIREYGSIELQELNHELLVRIYTIKYISDYTLLEAIIATIQGYISRSIENSNGSQLRVLDDNSLSNLIIKNKNCEALVLAIKAYLVDYNSDITLPMLQTLNTTTFINDDTKKIQTLLRKIEYCSYYILVSIQNALFGYYKINSKLHLQLLEGVIEADSTGDYIAKCFRLFNPSISYGLNSLSFGSKYDKLDRWLESNLPPMIERTHLPLHIEEAMVVSKIKKMINFDSLPSNPFTSELKEGDIQSMLSLEIFSLVTLLCWKSGLAWVPILGSLVPYLDDGPLGRLFGVTACLVATGFLTQNNIIELRFVPQALFANPTQKMISILFLGLMLGGIFAI